MQEYLRDAARTAPESISFSAGRVISGYCGFQDYEAVLLHKKEVEKPTTEEVWYAYANMQRRTSTNYRTTSEKCSACYVCGKKIAHSCHYNGGGSCAKSHKAWTAAQVIPFLNCQAIWNYRLVCLDCSDSDLPLYHGALVNNQDVAKSQAVRENITTLFGALYIYYREYTGEKMEGVSSPEE